MEIWKNVIVSLGITSPILIALSIGIFFILKSFIVNKIDQIKITSIENIKHNLELKSKNFENDLLIKYDRVKNNHEQQTIVLSAILESLNKLIVDKYNDFDYEDNSYTLFKESEVKRIKTDTYSRGLYIDQKSLNLINMFFQIAEKNSDWIYDAVGCGQRFNLNEFDLHLLEAINNEVFHLFRKQLNIDNEEITTNYNEIRILSLMVVHSSSLERENVEKLLHSKNDIREIIYSIKNDIELRSKIYEEVIHCLAEGEHANNTKHDLQEIGRYFKQI